MIFIIPKMNLNVIFCSFLSEHFRFFFLTNATGKFFLLCFVCLIEKLELLLKFINFFINTESEMLVSLQKLQGDLLV